MWQKSRFFILFISAIIMLFLFFSCKVSKTNLPEETEIERTDLRIMFYNTENYFDIYDDTLKDDDEFLPDNQRNWNSYRFNDKKNKIAKVITAVGGWQLPDVVGFCEIENHYVLEQLVSYSALPQNIYGIIHTESPDARGIDVGLIYKKESLTPLFFQSYRLYIPTVENFASRDILHAEFLTKQNDTLHIFVNHWPSRRGGQAASEPRRMAAANLLRQKTDSLFALNNNCNIIILGDFNDAAVDKSITEGLQAVKPDNEPFNEKLYNLTHFFGNDYVQGSYKYQGHWESIDQVIVSGGMLRGGNGLITGKLSANVFYRDFLLETDDQFTGVKPFRTFAGFNYQNGFSDHLPVFIDVSFCNKDN